MSIPFGPLALCLLFCRVVTLVNVLGTSVSVVEPSKASSSPPPPPHDYTIKLYIVQGGKNHLWSPSVHPLIPTYWRRTCMLVFADPNVKVGRHFHTRWTFVLDAGTELICSFQ